MKISVFVGVSVDGFLARPDGALDFLPHDESVSNGYEEFFASVDALVIGRKTYETALSFPSWPFGDKPVFVLSTHEIARPPEGAVVEQEAGEPDAIVGRLDARGFTHLYLDGGETIQGFLRAGRVDRLVITRVPVLIGEGIPLFGALPRDVVLRHVETRTLPGDLVQSEYDVER